MSEIYEDILIHFLSAESEYEMRATISISSSGMVFDLTGDDADRYLIRGQLFDYFYAGRDEMSDQPAVDVIARWAKLGDIWIGYWRENGEEYLFKFVLPKQTAPRKVRKVGKPRLK